MKYLKKLLKVLMYPFIFTIFTLFINYLFVCIYNKNLNMNNSELINYISTLEYKTNLNNYIISKSILIIFIISLIFIPLFIYVLKKYKPVKEFKINNIFLSLILGITISLVYNISIYNLNNIVHFTNNYDSVNMSLLSQIICTGIMGPILEELLFRGIVYNKLKTFNSNMKSIILTSVIFALFHSNLIDSIYAFAVSFILIYLYEKYKNIIAPIIMHMFLNITIILMIKVIKLNCFLINYGLIFISLIILIIIDKKCIKIKNVNNIK